MPTDLTHEDHPGNGYPIHPLAELFPLHDGPPMWDLRDDIKKNGQVEDITIWEGKVLDGRRRQVCCLAPGINPRYEKFNGTEDEALAFAVSKNLNRRHLSETERALVAAEIARYPRGTNQHRNEEPEPCASSNGATIDEAAKLMKVPARKVDQAKAVLKGGTPALVDATRKGDITLTDASRVVKEEPAVQDAAVAAVMTGKAKTAVQAVEKRTGDDEPGDVKRDALGIPIQPHAKEAFEAVEKFDELLSVLRKAKRLYSELANHPGGAYLLRPGISVNGRDSWKHKGIETALMNVADCKPTITVCPRAYHLEAFPDCQDKTPHGPDCVLCHGLNWSRPLAKNEIAPEVIAKTKEAFGV